MSGILVAKCLTLRAHRTILIERLKVALFRYAQFHRCRAFISRKTHREDESLHLFQLSFHASQEATALTAISGWTSLVDEIGKNPDQYFLRWEQRTGQPASQPGRGEVRGTSSMMGVFFWLRQSFLPFECVRVCFLLVNKFNEEAKESHWLL